MFRCGLVWIFQAVASALRLADALRMVTSKAATMVPTTMARMKAQTRSMAKKTKIPPWGALDAAPRAIDRAPVTAPPAIIEGMTRSGSAAAKGMAPSEMNEAPSNQVAVPFSRSAGW